MIRVRKNTTFFPKDYFLKDKQEKKMFPIAKENDTILRKKSCNKTENYKNNLKITCAVLGKMIYII